MAKYFECDALIAQMRAFKCGEEEYDDGIETAVNVCMIADAADVKPVVRARWKKNDNGTYFCDRCNSWIPGEQRHYANWCLHCGADMRGGDAE